MLNQALKKIDAMPDENFGTFDFDISTLPCIKKPKREKVTAMFDPDVIEAVQERSKAHGVSKSALINDILRKVLIPSAK